MFRDMTAVAVTLLLGIFAALTVITTKKTSQRPAERAGTVTMYRDLLLPQDKGLEGAYPFTKRISPERAGIPELPTPASRRCDRTVVVAVIDTGIDYTHPALAPYLWWNPGETGSDVMGRDRSANFVDDDLDGLKDDVIGYDFVTGRGKAYDMHSHGTHIAGIITGGFRGFDGACLRIMSLRYYDNSGSGYNNLNNTVKAIEYAVAHGVDIINYSGGGPDAATPEMNAVKAASDSGILFIAAAGNDGHDNKFAPYYPASYRFENVISVASVDRSNRVLPSSNYGSTVTLAAPGLGVMSTLPGGGYGTMSGTSQATANVTAAAASLMVRYEGPRETRAAAVRRALIEGAVRVKTVTDLGMAGIVSVDRSIELLFPQPRSAR